MASQEQKKGRTILVAIDEGEHSVYALQWASETLSIGSFPDDQIVILYAKPSHATLSGPAFVLTSEAVSSLERYDNFIVSRILSSVDQIFGDRKVHFEVKVVTGDARYVITETAHALQATFLVMGSHGFGAMKRVLLGSVSDYCSHHVHCPVVIVKKPAELSEE